MNNIVQSQHVVGCHFQHYFPISFNPCCCCVSNEQIFIELNKSIHSKDFFLQSKYFEWHLSPEITPWDFQLCFTLRSLHIYHMHLSSLPQGLVDSCLCLYLCPFLEHDNHKTCDNLTTVVIVALEFLLGLL